MPIPESHQRQHGDVPLDGSVGEQAACGPGVEPTVPTPDGGSLEKAITSVQDTDGDFWVSSVFFVHEIGLNAREKKFIFLCSDPRSDVIKPIPQPHWHSSAAPLTLPSRSCTSQGDNMQAGKPNSCCHLQLCPDNACLAGLHRGNLHTPKPPASRPHPGCTQEQWPALGEEPVLDRHHPKISAQEVSV